MSSFLSLGKQTTLLVVYAACTVVMLSPLLTSGADVLPDSDDAYFSAWRLAWVAHQLPRDPQHLFDANIFHPYENTYAFSDAMLLVTVAGAPLSWAGLPVSLVHNLLIAAAFVSSMWFAFALVRELTGSSPAAWLASIIFGFAPYRMAHIGHLELQWVMWMPLGLVLLHRFAQQPTAPRALAIGAAIVGQTFCSIYYGVFLSWYLAIAWLIVVVFTASDRPRVFKLTPLIAVPLFLLVAVYGPPYAQTRAEQGPRSVGEITEFSATPADFVRVPPHNRLRGTPGDTAPAPDERSLYPGAVALVLAIAALAVDRRPVVWIYAALAAVSVDASLGVNGFLMPAMQQVIPVTASFRSPARFGVLLLLSIAVLAGFGAVALFRWKPRAHAWLLTLMTAVCLAEYWSVPVRLRPGLSTPLEAHKFLASLPPGTVVVELPLPGPGSLWRYETTYQLRSIHHWQPLVNGYSGFAPREYLRSLHLMQGFPDATSVQRLRELQVRFVILNRALYSGEEFAKLIGTIDASGAFWPPQAFGSGDGQSVVVELKSQQ